MLELVGTEPTPNLSDLDPIVPATEPIPPNLFPKRKIFSVLGAIALALFTSYLIYLLNQPSINSDADNPNQSNPTLQTYSQNFESSPSLSSPVDSSLDEIIVTSGYTNKRTNFTDNSGPTLDPANLKIIFPQSGSSLLAKPVMAAEQRLLYPLYLQNPTLDNLGKMAQYLGIESPPIFPEPMLQYRVQYADTNKKFVYDPSSHTKLLYESLPADGTLPSFAQAKVIATTTLTGLGISLAGLTPTTAESAMASEFENLSVVHKVIAVTFVQAQDSYPIVMSDQDMLTGDKTVSSPAITVLIDGQSQVARISSLNFGQAIGPTPTSMHSRSLAVATADLQRYGGHIRHIQELGDSPTYFACADSNCNVYNATITQAKLGYYWNTDLPGFAYAEINDTQAHSFEYLVQVWIFEGTGTMDKSKTDETGKLLPNPNKSNPLEYVHLPVKFVATIPAFTQTSGVNLLGFRDYNLTKLANDQIKLTFSTVYQFEGGGLTQAEPRNGIKYRLLILFPDKTYSLINSYKQEVYPGEITFDIGTAKGAVTTYLELSDFSNLIEKRTLQID